LTQSLDEVVHFEAGSSGSGDELGDELREQAGLLVL
jgi:hypothetical protein